MKGRKPQARHRPRIMSNSNGTKPKPKAKASSKVSKEVWMTVEAQYLAGVSLDDIVAKFVEFGVTMTALVKHVERKGLSAKRQLVNEYALTQTIMRTADKMADEIINVKSRYASVWRIKLDEMLTDFAKAKTPSDRTKIIRAIGTIQEKEFECMGIASPKPTDDGSSRGGVQIEKNIIVNINTFKEAEGWG